MALFLPFLGGDTGRVMPVLERLAGAGFFAVSFDPWQHGARATEAPEPAILFEGGQADDHVPMEAASRFAAALADRSPGAGKNVTVRVTENLGHLDAVRNPDAVDRCLDWLTAG